MTVAGQWVSSRACGYDASHTLWCSRVSRTHLAVLGDQVVPRCELKPVTCQISYSPFPVYYVSALCLQVEHPDLAKEILLSGWLWPMICLLLGGDLSKIPELNLICKIERLKDLISGGMGARVEEVRQKSASCNPGYWQRMCIYFFNVPWLLRNTTLWGPFTAKCEVYFGYYR